MLECMAEKTTVLLVMRRQHRHELLGLLDNLGVSVLAASGCNEAILYLQQQSGMAVVFTDTDLQDGDWVWLLKQVQRWRGKTPVIVCSNYPTPDLVARVFENGASDILMAPYTEDEVRQILDLAVSTGRVASLAAEPRLGASA